MKVKGLLCTILFFGLYALFGCCFELQSYGIKREKEAILKIVYTSRVIHNGDLVTVEWQYIDDASLEDQIAVYCPSGLPDEHYKRLYGHRELPELGKSQGSGMIRVFYPRTSCEFRYLKINIDGQLFSIARTGNIVFADNLSTPTQIHIALATNESSVLVKWVSGSSLPPHVIFFSDKNRNKQMPIGSTTTYTANDMCEPPATAQGFMNPGYIHSVLLTNLEPDANYFYVVGNSEEMSDVYSFRSPKTVVHNKNQPTSFILFGDLDVTPFPGAYGTILRIEEELDNSNPPDSIFHIGDISYAMGYGHIWEEFFYMIQLVAPRVPYMVTIGNHEHDHVNGHDKDPSHDGPNFRPFPFVYHNDSGGECSVPMVHRFKMPETGNQPFWYFLDYGMVRFVCLSSEHDFRESSHQYEWFENVLKNVNRTVTPWLIVLIHRTLYTVSDGRTVDDASSLLRNSLEPLLINHKVDFLIGGHYHVYERTCPVRFGTCVKDNITPEKWGTVHLTVGAAGRELNEPIIRNYTWSKFVAFEYGYGKLVVHSPTTATWTFKRNSDNNIIDYLDYTVNHDF